MGGLREQGLGLHVRQDAPDPLLRDGEFPEAALEPGPRGYVFGGASTEDAIRYAFSTVGAALFVTTVALALGFMILAGSDFKVNATMGQMTAMVISIALVFDLLFLPGFLMRFDRRAAAREHAAGDVEQRVTP